ncbi:hypothetical protein VTK26DRAFT_2396 [Humicola hyalothermophila]
MATLLDRLRAVCIISCDTLDAEVASNLGPFADCTSNQAIALAELNKVDAQGKPLHQQLIAESIQVAHWLFGKQADATLEELAVELMMVALSIRIAPHTTGFLHVQTNPKFAYSTHKTVKNAERILAHFKQLAPELPPSRVCIKIPSTWEGLQACRELEAKGIATLATTLFSIAQAVLAVDAGCRYVAPYVNELRVHVDPSYVDTNPNLLLCTAAQRYIDQLSQGTETAMTTAPRTQVLAASLTSGGQAVQLATAGVAAMTLSPAVLTSLAGTPTAATGSGAASLVVDAASTATSTESEGAAVARLKAAMQDESSWRMAFTRSDGGRCESRLVQALNIFADAQEALEEIVRRSDVAPR